jgi:hypothetical protein
VGYENPCYHRQDQDRGEPSWPVLNAPGHRCIPP